MDLPWRKKSPYLIEDPTLKPPLTDGLLFNCCVAVATILNIFALGLETDLGCFLCDPSERVPTFALTDVLFAVFFGAELVFRIVVGKVGFILGQRRIKIFGASRRMPDVVNLVDTALVLSRIIGLVTSTMPGWEGLKLFSMLRVFRVAAVFDSFRLDPRFREIVLVILVSRACAKVLICFVILALPVVWAAAVLMTVSVGHSDEAEATVDYSDVVFTVYDYWGTVPRSAFTLFQVVTLDRWSSVLVAPVFREYPGLYILVFSFLGIGVLAMANLIVSIVVSNTLQMAKMLQEEEVKQKVEIKKKVMESLRLIFAEGDDDHSGELDEEELTKTRANPDVQSRLQMLGIPLADLDWVFRLFEQNSINAGNVPIKKFFRGCSRIQGPALASDLQSMSVDFERNIKRTVAITENMENSNQLLHTLLDDIREVDTDVIKGNADHKDPVLAARRARAKAKESRASNARMSMVSVHHALLAMKAMEGGPGSATSGSRVGSKKSHQNMGRRNSGASSQVMMKAVASVNSQASAASRLSQSQASQESQPPPANPGNALTDGMALLGDSALQIQTLDYNAGLREMYRSQLELNFRDGQPPMPPPPPRSGGSPQRRLTNDHH